MRLLCSVAAPAAMSRRGRDRRKEQSNIVLCRVRLGIDEIETGNHVPILRRTPPEDRVIGRGELFQEITPLQRCSVVQFFSCHVHITGREKTF